MEYLEILKNLSGKGIDEINIIFQRLLNKLQSYLRLEPVESLVKIVEIIPENIGEKEEKSLALGIKRESEGNLLIIKFLSVYRKYLPITLLREAYYCFIPNTLIENLSVKIVITRIVEISLQRFEFNNEWKTLFENYITDYVSQFKSLGEEFFKHQGDDASIDPVRFLLNYIRKNVQSISEYFFEDMHEEFILTTSKSMKRDDIIETLRIIIKIFYNLKNYRALLDYQRYFKELKENKEIKTELSLNKFTENLKRINKINHIAPSYSHDWNRLNLNIDFFIIRFHPYLKESQIRKLFEKIPFYYNWKLSVSNFAIEVSGRFFIPVYYQNDLYNFFSRLENDGFIIEKRYISSDYHGNYLNLNYFREFYKKGRIVNPKHPRYDKKYEIYFRHNYGQYSEFKKCSILKFIILTRVGYWSSDGFGFERSSETTRRIKSDIFKMLTDQKVQIRNLKKSFVKFQSDPELKRDFLLFLESNRNLGFFYIKELLENLLTCLIPIMNILKKNPDIKNEFQLQENVKSETIFQLIEKNIIFENRELKRVIYRDLIPIYFKDKSKFNREINKYRTYAKFLKYCNKLKIFNLESIRRIIENEEVVKKIYTTKEKKLKKIHQNYKLQDITSKDVEDALDSMQVEAEIPLFPLLETKVSFYSVIKPLLISTINTTNFAKYFVELILKDNPKNQKIIYNLFKYIPRINQRKGIEINSKEKLTIVHFYLPVLNISEKELFFSILNNLFGNDLINLKSYFFDGFYVPGNIAEYYDPEEQDFFYTRDFFVQFHKYIKNIFGNKLEPIKETPIVNQNIFWTSDKNLDKLVNQVDDRIRHEHIEFDIKDLENLTKFHAELQEIIKDDEFKEIKNKKFFKNYVKSIKFKTSLSNFGLARYFLYVRPTNMNDVDLRLRLLFANTFYKVKYPAKVDNVQSLFISYFFPYRNPNIGHLNWLVKSKKIISEYCIFFIKKVHILFHFDYNLTSEGWNLGANNFKTYGQKVLFDPKFKNRISEIKTYNLETTNYYGPKSIFFENLTEIQTYKKIDLKSVLGSRNQLLIEKILTLLKNKIIYPYIKLKNLNFKEKIYIILPSIKKELIDIIVKVFSFFNYGFIYEIEGEYFIRGLPEEKKFDYGLMIKLYLPMTEFEKLQRIFGKIFQYLNIEKYLILNNMINGINLIKSVYGNLDFLKSYNPLKNLIWNDKDEIWMNHKLYNEKFEPQYPDLF